MNLGFVGVFCFYKVKSPEKSSCVVTALPLYPHANISSLWLFPDEHRCIKTLAKDANIVENKKKTL
jgi:hypothetical protein